MQLGQKRKRHFLKSNATKLPFLGKDYFFQLLLEFAVSLLVQLSQIRICLCMISNQCQI